MDSSKPDRRLYEERRGPDPDGRFSDQQAPPAGWQQFANPPGWPLTGQEFLRVTTCANVAGVTLTITARVRAQDGEVTRTTRSVVPAATRTVATLDINIGDGALLGVIVRASAGLASGNAVYVNLDLVIGLSGEQQHLVGLGSGYVTTTQPLMVPGGVNWAPIEGAGCVRSITGTTPGAGVNITETVPSNARWQLLGFRFQFVTSAVVATRVPSILIDDGSNPAFWCVGPPAGQAASITGVYFAGIAQNSISPATNAIQSSLPDLNYLLAGYRIRTQTAALDAADQFSQVQYLVREWLDI